MNRPIVDNARSITIPAPVGGLNTKDPLDGMDVFYAIEMDNWFPEERGVRVRGGTSLFCSGLGTDPVETLIEHNSAAGTRSFLACCDDEIFNVTSGTASSLKSSLTNGRWQHTKMNAVTVLVNGADQPQQWNGSAISDATYTGIADDAKLIQGTNYRSRLWFVDTDGKVWYGGVRSITGALTEFPVGYEFQRGGYPMWVATWTRGNGDVTQDLWVCCTSEGEVLVYAGSSPDSDAFSLVGRAFLGKPLGRRSYQNVGTELEILTEDGIIPLSRVMSDPLSVISPLTDKIYPSFNRDAASYSTNFGWQASVYTKGRYAIYNIPVLEGEQSGQYVRNLYTGAWTRFVGWNAACFATFNANLYFGGPNGNIYLADTGMSDNGSNIATRLSFAFNYLGDREHLKKLAFFRPIVVANESITFQTGADVDFETTDLVDTITTTADEGAEWNTAEWNTAEWAHEEISASDWYGVTGLGRAISLKLRADLSGVQPSMTAVHLLFQGGGTL